LHQEKQDKTSILALPPDARVFARQARALSPVPNAFTEILSGSPACVAGLPSMHCQNALQEILFGIFGNVKWCTDLTG
jgi:hypothetical protein